MIGIMVTSQIPKTAPAQRIVCGVPSISPKKLPRNHVQKTAERIKEPIAITIQRSHQKNPPLGFTGGNVVWFFMGRVLFYRPILGIAMDSGNVYPNEVLNHCSRFTAEDAPDFPGASGAVPVLARSAMTGG